MRTRDSLEAAYQDKINCAMVYEDSGVRQQLINKIDNDYDLRSAEMDIEEKR